MDLKLFLPVAFKKSPLDLDAEKIILAGDIGGTKANMMLAHFIDDDITLIKEQRYLSKDFDSFTDILTDFLKDAKAPDAICFSVAGPVLDGKVKFTNLSWNIDCDEVAKHTGAKTVSMLNDLEATAYGLAALKKEEVQVLYQGDSDAKGNIGIVAAGTGLGEAGLYFDGTQYHPFATEGGHSDFAPRNQRDAAMLDFLWKRHVHVSWERLLSGNGIYTIWQFLTEVEKKESPAWLLNAMKDTDPAPVISKAAMEKTCPVCVEAIEMFNRYLAIEAVNMILKIKAAGGLYLAGGIAPKLLSMLDVATWKKVFDESGRMRHLLVETSVYVVLNEKAPLLGAAYYACLS